MSEVSTAVPNVNTSTDTNVHTSNVSQTHEANPLVKWLVTVAGDTPGKFIVAAYGEGIKEVRHVLNGKEAAAGIVRAIRELQAIDGANVYIMPALMRPDLPDGRKGGIADVVAVLAAVVDFDDDKAADYLNRLPGDPHAVVETSAGRFHCWYFFDKPYAAEAAGPVIKALATQAGADTTGGEASHIFRVPGCLNIPGPSKLKAGRTVEMAKLIAMETDEWITTSPDGLRAAIVTKWPAAFAEKPREQAAPPSASRGDPPSRKQIEAMLAVLDPSMPRDDWRAVGAALRATDDGNPELDLFGAFDGWSSKGGNYVGEADCWKLWDTMPPKDGGIGLATLIYLARAAGYRGPIDGTPSEEVFGRAVAEWFTADRAKAEGQTAELDGPIPFSDLLARPDPGPVKELIPGLIEKGIFTLLAAPGGAHKSRLAVQWGLCIEAGSAVFGRPVEQAAFVYLSHEDPAEEVTRRTKAITRRLKLPDDTRAAYWDRTSNGSPLAIVTEAGPALQPFYDRLRSYLLSRPGHKFLVADSAYNILQFEGRAKVDETAVKLGLELLNRLCRETDTTMLVLWHPSQAGQERGDASGWSVAWHNTPRARLSITAVKDTDAYDLKVEKRNNAAKGQTITLRYCDGVMLPQTEADVAELEGRFMDACVSVAIVAAEDDQPFTRQKHVPDWALNEIEGKAGRRPTQRELKEALSLAVRLGRLRYQKGYGKERAGYFPPSSPGEIALLRAGGPMTPARMSLMKPVETGLKPPVETMVSTGFNPSPEQSPENPERTIGCLNFWVVETGLRLNPPIPPMAFARPCGAATPCGQEDSTLRSPRMLSRLIKVATPTRRCLLSPISPNPAPIPATVMRVRVLMLRLSIIRTNLVRIVPPPRGPETLVPCLPIAAPAA